MEKQLEQLIIDEGMKDKYELFDRLDKASKSSDRNKVNRRFSFNVLYIISNHNISL